MTFERQGRQTVLCWVINNIAKNHLRKGGLVLSINVLGVSEF